MLVPWTKSWMWSKKIIIFHFLLEFHGLEYRSLSSVESTNFTHFQGPGNFPHQLLCLFSPFATFTFSCYIFIFFGLGCIFLQLVYRCIQVSAYNLLPDYNTAFVFCILYKGNIMYRLLLLLLLSRFSRVRLCATP